MPARDKIRRPQTSQILPELLPPNERFIADFARPGIEKYEQFMYSHTSILQFVFVYSLQYKHNMRISSVGIEDRR
jgi:hypothetical protein